MYVVSSGVMPCAAVAGRGRAVDVALVWCVCVCPSRQAVTPSKRNVCAAYVTVILPSMNIPGTYLVPGILLYDTWWRDTSTAVVRNNEAAVMKHNVLA